MNNYKNKKIFIFDIDGTIAESYGPITSGNAKLICNLLTDDKAVIFATDRSEDSIIKNVISLLPCEDKYFSKIYLLPAGGAAMYRWEDKQWVEVFAERVNNFEKGKLIESYKQILYEVDKNMKENGIEPYILDKNGLMLSCSALMPGATKEERRRWDPDQTRREKIIKAMQKQFPSYDIRIGGLVTVNIVGQNVDKAYGVKKLFNILDFDLKEALFVGDAIYPGGNDYCILDVGMDVLKVNDPDDTFSKLQL